MSLAEWDGLAPLAAAIGLAVLAVWPEGAAPTAATAGRDWEDALEEAPAGQTVPWTDPGSGEFRLLRPAGVFRAGNGLLCRRYEVSLADPGGPAPASRHLACRLSQGGWREQPANAASVVTRPQQLAVAPM